MGGLIVEAELGSAFVDSCLLRSLAKSAHKIDDKADDQKEAKPTTANYRTTEIKPATTEHQTKNHQYK